MNEDYISKKELLELTGISYGQLYRWKRMDIIPESWFVKKASFTGQETFFPKEKILNRVNKIIELKDEFSLEELARFFSPNPSKIELTRETLVDKGIVGESITNLFVRKNPNQRIFSFLQILYMSICEEAAKKVNMTIEEANEKLLFLHEDFDLNSELIAININNEMLWMLVPAQVPVRFESQANILFRINLHELSNELKIMLSEII